MTDSKVTALQPKRDRLRAAKGRRTVRAILIDADERTFTEVTIELSGDRELDAKRIAVLLQCEPTWFGTMSWLTDAENIDGVPIGDIVLAVDGSSPDAEWHGWFQLDDQEALEGRGLVISGDVAADQRVYYDAEISLEELQSRVKFTRRRMIRGPVDADGSRTCKKIIEDATTAGALTAETPK